ncbi:MAG: hypothetical protein AB7O98_07855 [Hyphomonadaceae bacterium]
MRGPPIPQRIPPLRWRGPAFLWTPLGIALAIAAPAGVFFDDPGLQRVLLAGGVVVFTIAMITLGVAWALGGAPKARRQVVAHIMTAGVLTSLAVPFLLPDLVATAGHAPERLSLAMTLMTTPLALVIGLPMSLLAALIFAWIALVQPDADSERLLEDDVFRRDVQPFR